ncbi:hypothetical protein QJS10_CPB19g00346 [Acorus calamus]|uniref:Reverse transcriptase n=1 Tax=Acorus calamus TaxID=4465 RepID=A0AAV9CEB3_ACOCL|nr:hypothetical protein QJS10_CPB19g00346 [Acorus calamus]
MERQWAKAAVAAEWKIEHSHPPCGPLLPGVPLLPKMVPEMDGRGSPTLVRGSEEEIQRVIFSAEGDKASGPDGFTFRFFQTFWTLVKVDILQVFTKLQSGTPGLGRLNASLFTLIPKRDGASDVDEYCLICLVNVCYMIVSKVLATRMKLVSADLIEEEQTAFIPGGNLEDGYMVAQEIITALTKDKRSGVALKLYFAKA